MNFVIPRQCGKTISINGTDIRYLAILSDCNKRILNCSVITTEYKKAILDNFLSDNSKLQLL